MRAEDAARRVKVLVLDVDGVLTDGGLYYTAEGLAMKRFNVQDGLGIKLAQAAGLTVGVITGLDSPCVARRVHELGIRHYFPGFRDKGDSLRAIAEAEGVGLEEMAFLGDDWVDVKPLAVVGLPMAVANAQPEILEMAAWVSTRPGGHGAVREAIRFILHCQGRLEAQWAAWNE
ncbi:MAG: HAD hydrolase family protein [Desulfovibrionaceae bacterium]|nr:HAD hydrolase family protein [Desulfovibrionaceae bacterium]